MIKKCILFLDGVFLPAHELMETSFAPTRIEGHGVFETMLGRGEKVFFLKEHLRRFEQGLRYFRIKPPFSSAELEECVKKVTAANRHSQSRVRLLAWKDHSGYVHTTVTAVPEHHFSEKKHKIGLRAVIASQRCRATIRTAHVKSLKYEPYMSAYRQALAKGFEEAILLNTRGELTEGSRTNLFFIKGGKLFTPSLDCGCLNGVVRQVILRIARSLKIPFKEGRFKPADLKKADEAFVTNSILGIIPLTCVGPHKISPKSGFLTQKLIMAYKKRLAA